MLTLRAWIPATALLLSLIVAGCSNKNNDPAPAQNQTPALAKAYGLTALAADGAATLSWPVINGATKYHLYWSTGADVNTATASKLANVSSPYTHAGLNNGTAYRYLFTAVTAAGETPPSPAVKVTPKTPQDGAPAKVSVLAGDRSITLLWDAVPTATGYNIYWNTTGDVGRNDQKVAHVSYPAVHTGLTNGQQYYYTVTAETPHYGEAASAEVSTAPHIAAPGPPGSVSVSAGDQRANLTWTKVDDASAYAIYWKQDSNGNDVSLADARIEVTTPNYTHTGLTNNARYAYRIAALNAQGPSVLSAAVSAKPHVPAPGAPGNVTAHAGNEQITLTWDAVAGASQYNLYWDTGAAVTVIANVKPPFVHQPLRGGVAVNYAVSALRDGVESASSAQISATPLGPLPPTPVLSAQATLKQVELTWPAVPGALGYQVYWHLQGNPAETLVTTTDTRYTHTGLLDSTTYVYRIVAITADGISLPTEAQATTLAENSPTSNGPPPVEIPSTYRVGGTITGLISSSNGLVLTLTNSTSNALLETYAVPRDATQSFTFTSAVQPGTYRVAVTASPSTPISHSCSVDAGTGSVTIINQDIASVVINCLTNSFAVGGTVTGLTGTESVELTLTTGTTQTTTVTAPITRYAFSAVLSGTNYTLKLATNPKGKTCRFADGKDSVTNAIVNTDIIAAVTCVNNYAVGGTLSGLVGSGLRLMLNDGATTQTLPISTPAAGFAFPVMLPEGARVTVSVVTQPSKPTQTCRVTGGATGTVTSASANAVAVTCAFNWGRVNPRIVGNLAAVTWNGRQLIAVGQGTITGTISNGKINWVPANNQRISKPIWTGTQWVAIDADTPGTILTSADGMVWTPWKSGTTNVVRKIIWTGSQLVAVGDAGTILTSTDGQIWSSQVSNTTNALNGIVWTGSQFVVVGDAGTILTSTNGSTWSTAPALPSSDVLTSIIWTGSQMVAMSNSAVFISSNGMEWVNRTPTGIISAIDAIASNGNQIILTSYTQIFMSTDGTSWTSISSPPLTRFVTWTGIEFIVTGYSGKLMTSPDGLTWTEQTTTTMNWLYEVTRVGELLVAVGEYGTILTSSDNGVTWTHEASTEHIRDMVTNGAQWVGVGESGSILTSPDGVNWTPRSTATPVQYLWSVAETSAASIPGIRFIAVGSLGAILTSPDGITWTSQNSTTTQMLWGVTWSGGLFVAVGEGGTIVTSNDGITWSPSVSGTTQSFRSVAGDGKQWVAVSHGSTVGGVASGTIFTGSRNVASSSGIDWVSSATVPMYVSYGVSWSAGQWLVGGYPSNTSTYTSTDGMSWRPVSLTAGNGYNYRFFKVGNQWLSAGTTGDMITSTDGDTWTASPELNIPFIGAGWIDGLAWSGNELMAYGFGGLIYVTQ
ncbi:MAG: fibronectin type III domain-containing protein [Gammaproteobacteria bacterium]|nr:fibronectin type III domain-containing protein [Gammaproteobacteria bacterium]